MILDDLLAADRRLRLAVKAVRAAPDHVPALAALVADYLEAYCRHYGFDAARAGAVCNDFTERYLADLAAFRKTGKYPRALGKPASVKRVEYDLMLVLSYLLAEHRFTILRQLGQKAIATPTVVVGCGSGVELKVLTTTVGCPRIDAYDISLNEFGVAHNNGVAFHETTFTSAQGKYGQAIAIELLEHLERPFELLARLLDSVPAGRIIFTTAHNLPQFDHVYNFADLEVEEWLAKRGERAIAADKIVHRMIDGSTDIYNKFYIVERG